jgi:hypothetical protein
VWVRAAEPFLTQVSRAEGTVQQRYSSPDAPSIGDIAVAFGSVWTSASEDSTVLRLDVDP